MYDLTITEDLKDYLKEIRKKLKEKGYKQVKSKCRRKIGGMQLNYDYEYFIKGNLLFELEKDNINNTLTTRFEYKKDNQKEYGEIMLSSILDMC